MMFWLWLSFCCMSFISVKWVDWFSLEVADLIVKLRLSSLFICFDSSSFFWLHLDSFKESSSVWDLLSSDLLYLENCVITCLRFALKPMSTTSTGCLFKCRLGCDVEKSRRLRKFCLTVLLPFLLESYNVPDKFVWEFHEDKASMLKLRWLESKIFSVLWKSVGLMPSLALLVLWCKAVLV